MLTPSGPQHTIEVRPNDEGKLLPEDQCFLFEFYYNDKNNFTLRRSSVSCLLFGLQQRRDNTMYIDLTMLNRNHHQLHIHAIIIIL